MNPDEQYSYEKDLHAALQRAVQVAEARLQETLQTHIAAELAEQGVEETEIRRWIAESLEARRRDWGLDAESLDRRVAERVSTEIGLNQGEVIKRAVLEAVRGVRSEIESDWSTRFSQLENRLELLQTHIRPDLLHIRGQAQPASPPVHAGATTARTARGAEAASGARARDSAQPNLSANENRGRARFRGKLTDVRIWFASFSPILRVTMGVITLLVAIGLFVWPGKRAASDSPAVLSRDTATPDPLSSSTASRDPLAARLQDAERRIREARPEDWALLARRVRQGSNPELLAILSRWENGQGLSSADTERLQVAFLQASFVDLAGQQFRSLDGMTNRNPCSGETCEAVLAYWSAHRDALPTYRDDPSEEELRTVERLILAHWLQRDAKP